MWQVQAREEPVLLQLAAGASGLVWGDGRWWVEGEEEVEGGLERERLDAELGGMEIDGGIE